MQTEGSAMKSFFLPDPTKEQFKTGKGKA